MIQIHFLGVSVCIPKCGGMESINNHFGRTDMIMLRTTDTFINEIVFEIFGPLAGNLDFRFKKPLKFGEIEKPLKFPKSDEN